MDATGINVGRTHASFFSGVGGLDLGLERAGWHTVSFSEIDPYASAVLAERWPEVVNLGDIVELANDIRPDGEPRPSAALDTIATAEGGERVGDRVVASGAATATLWSGGFPCQDLSVAGKRRGMGTDDERTRSGLAYAFLDLVEQHRPPAILLENVPGLLSSNGGKDFGALLGRLAELGYWWAYRILDAQYFGVPQRRRRVFICALHAGAGFGADSPAAVLSVGSRCGGHSATGNKAGTGASGVLADGATSTRTIQSAFGHHGWTLGYLQVAARSGHQHYAERAPSDPGGVREADGLAGRLDDPLLPLGLDSHRYRCCGNGVVSNVSEWIGERLARVFTSERER